ncbi:MAG TPA: pyridoxamine 5'-phosphate oxidase family protein [Mycobacterium sp.]|nr:pyridoxamine 5'-phosphate oxidase family protein [Mycobacterium sp.]HWT47822.1 pyridoxamine 5'-phosphate oxidase family protein [Mycobacterium sp.]
MRDCGDDGGLDWARYTNGTEPLDSATAMGLLTSVDYGRLVFKLESRPAIRPVNHLVDEGRIIVRTRLTSSISAAVQSIDGVEVAYEVDRIDPWRRTGWSVIVTGRAHTLTDPDQVSRYEELLHPWVDHADSVIAIEPEVVTGLRIIAPQC